MRGARRGQLAGLTVTTEKPVSYKPPFAYVLTVRLATLKLGSGDCTLVVETTNQDSAVTKYEVAHLGQSSGFATQAK